ncbi:MAG: ATP-binding cassette domain-containing protein, partial [bacterium]
NKRKSIAERLLSQVGLKHRLHHKPAELSGGEAQRVAIARALANNPALLLADEPTGNLDSLTAEEIIALIRNLNHDHGLTVLMVTHEQEIVESVSHKVIHLLDGKIVHQD